MLLQLRTVLFAAGHSKRVTAAVWGQDSLLITGSNDKTLRFWKHTPAEGEGDAAAGAVGGSWACAATATEHEAEIRGLALHPSRVYGVSVSADASWAWWDLAEAKCLKQVCYQCQGGGQGDVRSWGVTNSWGAGAVGPAEAKCLKQVGFGHACLLRDGRDPSVIGKAQRLSLHLSRYACPLSFARICELAAVAAATTGVAPFQGPLQYWLELVPWHLRTHLHRPLRKLKPDMPCLSCVCRWLGLHPTQQHSSTLTVCCW